jgi:6,7-dimethyl-8-ribityllumazine synthase
LKKLKVDILTVFRDWKRISLFSYQKTGNKLKIKLLSGSFNFFRLIFKFIHMATINLSDYNPNTVPDGNKMKIGIVVSEWNSEVTNTLLQGAYDTLVKHGVKEKNIFISCVPGSFELIYGCVHMAENMDMDGIIALGCIVRGGTPHFDYVCQGTTYGIAKLNTEYDIPFIFGLLTTDDMKQALDRAGGMHGNKGTEAAITAIKMINFAWSLKK